MMSKKRIENYAECIKSHNTEESEDDEEFEV